MHQEKKDWRYVMGQGAHIAQKGLSNCNTDNI